MKRGSTQTIKVRQRKISPSKKTPLIELVCKILTAVDKNNLKFSPTVKIINIESNSMGTPPFELITSSNPNNFMNDDAPTTQQDVKTYKRPSCSYNAPRASTPPPSKGIMQSTHKMDQLVSKIYLEKPEREALHATTTPDTTSTVGSPVQSADKKRSSLYR